MRVSLCPLAVSNAGVTQRILALCEINGFSQSLFASSGTAEKNWVKTAAETRGHFSLAYCISESFLCGNENKMEKKHTDTHTHTHIKRQRFYPFQTAFARQTYFLLTLLFLLHSITPGTDSGVGWGWVGGWGFRGALGGQGVCAKAVQAFRPASSNIKAAGVQNLSGATETIQRSQWAKATDIRQFCTPAQLHYGTRRSYGSPSENKLKTCRSVTACRRQQQPCLHSPND